MKTRGFIAMAVAVVSLSYFYPKQEGPSEKTSDLPVKHLRQIPLAPALEASLESRKSTRVESQKEFSTVMDEKNQNTGLQAELNERLSLKQFSQQEIDLVSWLLDEAFLQNPQTIDLTNVMKKASQKLSLNSSRKEELQKAILQAIAATHSRIRYEDISACMNRRLQYENDCVKDFAEDLLRQIAANSDGSAWDAQTLATMDAKLGPLKTKAQKTCQRSSAEVQDLFDLYLTHC